jgi:adenosylmethionine-8-amino-7-oxononanoate aminotransferase
MDERESLIRWDKEYIWHPFTQMKEYVEIDPVIVDRGDGFYLVDIEGRRYIDGVSSLWVIVHGHGKRELIDAIKRQVDTLCHSTLLGIANSPSIILAKMLVEIAPPGIKKVFYSDNGSTSVEIALKMAYQYWQHMGEKGRKRFISFKNGYHGDTIGSVSVGGVDLFHKVYRPLLFKSYKAHSPYCYRCPFKLEKDRCGMACVEEFERIVKAHKDEVCAVIIEPLVQAAGGMIVQPDGFLSAIWRVIRENGLFMIADEVATGFGKTGTMFACDKEGVRPDLLCIAKSVTGGYLPLAATMTTKEVFDGFLGRYEDFKTFFHGHTYTGNPVACAAAIENITLYKEEGILEGLKRKIALLEERLKPLDDFSHVGEVRQSGFMVGIELVKDKKRKRPYRPEERIGQRVTLEARRRGAIIRPLDDVIVLMPPLAIPEEMLIQLVDIVSESIKVVTD